MPFIDTLKSVFKRSLVTIEPEGGDPIVLDASVEETHTASGTLSSHPVESGVDVSDHYHVDPRGLSIEGVVSNSPLSQFAIPGATAVESVSAIAAGDTDPVKNAWEALQAIVDEATVVTVTTSLQVYESMVIESLNVLRNAQTGNRLEVSIRLRRIRFVETSSADAINLSTGAPAKKVASRGPQSNAASDATKAADTRSGLAKLQDAAVSFFNGGQ